MPEKNRRGWGVKGEASQEGKGGKRETKRRKKTQRMRKKGDWWTEQAGKTGGGWREEAEAEMYRIKAKGGEWKVGGKEREGAATGKERGGNKALEYVEIRVEFGLKREGEKGEGEEENGTNMPVIPCCRHGLMNWILIYAIKAACVRAHLWISVHMVALLALLKSLVPNPFISGNPFLFGSADYVHVVLIHTGTW